MFRSLLAVVVVTVAGLATVIAQQSPASAAPTLPAGFTWTPQDTGLGSGQLSDFVFLDPSGAGGGVLAIGKSGGVRYVAPGGSPQVVSLVPAPNFNDAVDLGLLGIALANDYGSSGRVYLYYTYCATAPCTNANTVARLGRYTAAPLNAPTTLTYDGSVLDGIPAEVFAHGGGSISVASDGTLWVTTGDFAHWESADPVGLQHVQDTNDPHGKILHVNDTGTGVSTNPFYDSTQPNAWISRVYAYGFREPFRMTLRPGSEVPYVGEVGWDTTEEIDVIEAGGNYGWPCWEGDSHTPHHGSDAVDYAAMAGCQPLYTAPPPANLKAPLWSYAHVGDSAVTGGVFYTGTSYPAKYQGAYFFGDYARSRIWTLDADDADPVPEDFASSIGGPSRFHTAGQAGDIYVSDVYTGMIWHLGYTPPVTIDQHYAELGGAGGFLGNPTGAEHDVPGVPGARARDYQNGTIYWSAASGAHEVHGAIRAKYVGLGGPSSVLGFPLTDESPVADGVGRYNTFQFGTISWSPATGAHEVHGAIRDIWAYKNFETGLLGYPLTDETSTPDGVGRYNHFQFGSIYWSPATGAQEVRTGIRDKWASLGWERGFLGYPTTLERSTIFGTGHYNDFQGGSIYESDATGAHEVHGAIRQAWADLGYEFRFLGFPSTDQQPTMFGTGAFNNFVGGSIYWSPTSGAHEVHGAIRDKWASLGWEFGLLGFPVTNETPTADGVGRTNGFQRGSVYWSPASGAHEVHGSIDALYQQLGGPSSFLGYPVTDESRTLFGVGRYNHFQGGSIYWSPATGAFEVHGAIRDKWASLGWEFGFLGFPVTNESPAANGGRFNGFQGGTVYWSPASGSHEVHGAIRGAYEFLGGPSSSLGYPVTDEFSLFGLQLTIFEHGWIDWTPVGGAHAH